MSVASVYNVQGREFPKIQEIDSPWFSELSQKVNEITSIIFTTTENDLELLQRSFSFIGDKIAKTRAKIERRALFDRIQNDTELMGLLAFFIAKTSVSYDNPQEIATWLSRVKTEVARLLVHLQDSSYLGNLPKCKDQSELKERAHEIMWDQKKMKQLFQKAVDISLIECFKLLIRSYSGRENKLDLSLDAGQSAAKIRQWFLDTQPSISDFSITGAQITCLPPEICQLSITKLHIVKTKIATLPPTMKQMSSLMLHLSQPSSIFEFPDPSFFPKELQIMLDSDLEKSLQAF